MTLKMIHRTRAECGICKNSDLKTVIEYGLVPLAGDFPSSDQLQNGQKYNLNIQFCTECGLLQTDSTIDAGTLFKDYRYISSVGLAEHFSAVATQIKSKFNPRKVLEIGSNDGVLLKPLSDLGIDAFGVDPAINICKIAESKGCHVYNEYFNEDFVRGHELDNHFDFIVSNNCFAHIEDIRSVVAGVKRALCEDGHFQIEVHYVKSLIDELQYDNIYHEHLYYYSLSSLHHLFSKNGMTIVDYEEIPIHSGSIRVIVKNCVSPLGCKISERLRLERECWGVTSLGYFTNFGERVDKHIQSIGVQLNKLKGKIVGYGASGRANMVCALANIGPQLVEYIVDDSPERNGRYISATHIPIVDKNHLDKDPIGPEYILIFAWNFAEPIMEKLQNNQYKYIILFPEVRILGDKKHV
tara:strand:+ start:725 stop:1957 length:1233 start_codon:yes stop_codon:yes gene_type:complete